MESHHDYRPEEPPTAHAGREGGRAHSPDDHSTSQRCPPLPMSPLAWGTCVFILLDCILKILALYWLVVGPELAPNLPGIQKPMKQPALAVSMVIVTLPCLLCLGVSKCRTVPHMFFISGIFGCEAVLLLVYFTFVAGNLGAPGVYVAAAVILYRHTRKYMTQHDIGAQRDGSHDMA